MGCPDICIFAPAFSCLSWCRIGSGLGKTSQKLFTSSSATLAVESMF
jgi:hypothetical protein